MKRSALKSNPEATRAWQDRSRANAIERATNGDGRHAGPRRRKGHRRLPQEKGWTRRVFALYGAVDVVTGRRAVQAHHAVPRHVILAAARLPLEQREALAYDERNGVPVSKRTHERHETATERILRSCLPAGVIAWAYEYGFGWYIDDERIYPRLPPSWDTRR